MFAEYYVMLAEYYVMLAEYYVMFAEYYVMLAEYYFMFAEYYVMFAEYYVMLRNITSCLRNITSCLWNIMLQMCKTRQEILDLRVAVLLPINSGCCFANFANLIVSQPLLIFSLVAHLCFMLQYTTFSAHR